MDHPLPSLPVLGRALALHLRAQRSGDEHDRALSRGGLRLLRDFAIRQSIVGVGRALDHVVAPGFRSVEPRAPLFVVAPPRSGTTLLYNLLASDPRFVGPRLYETILPSLSMLWLVEQLAARLGEDSKVRQGFARYEQEVLVPFDEVHRIRYGELEEDTSLFDRHLRCPTAMRFFVHSDRLAPMLALDDQPDSVRRSVMRSYRSAVQRLLHRAPGRSYLAKNVFSAGRVGSLVQTFPDARFVHIVRHPYRVVPSALRLIRLSGDLGLPPELRPDPPPGHPYWHTVTELVVDSYRRLLRWERELPRHQWLTLRFEDLVSDPRSTVEGLYDHFGLERTPEDDRRLAEATADAGRHRSGASHAPTLEDYGLTRAQIHEAIPDVFEAYGFEP